jgi:pimeloyl-ACP methyl ester carboxylesterase
MRQPFALGTQTSPPQSGTEQTTSFIEQRLIPKDGRTLGFAEYGDPNGEPVLEFHGCPGSRLEAWNYDDAGKKVGARVIGIDRPGFGMSTYAKGYRIVDWPSDVLEFADALGLRRFAVMGISSGSPYALACAKFMRERLEGCAVVSGISPLKVKGEKLNPSHYAVSTEILMARLANTIPFVARKAFDYILRQIGKDPGKAMKKLMKGAPSSDLELLKDERATYILQQNIAEWSRGDLKGLIDSFGLELKDWGFRLQDIRMHVSIWQGEADNLAFPAAANYMASKLPKHTLHMIPHAGHLTVIARYAQDVLRELLAGKPTTSARHR